MYKFLGLSVLSSILFLAFTAPFQCFAESYALLIGISDYMDPKIPDLRGPIYDLESMKNTLMTSCGITEIKILKDAEATRARILKSIEALQSYTKKGDFIFLYFSGHGTSPLDPVLAVPMEDGTGAIVPYDVSVAENTDASILEKIIIGKRDLKPILSRLESERKIFVVFDSSYSGNAVRKISGENDRPRYLPLALPNSLQARLLLHDPVSDPYPYRNIMYLSAAGNSESAWELSASDISFDGNPHGALTEALLRAMSGSADSNQDRAITYRELYDFVKTNIKKAQMPRLLGDSELDQPVFSITRVVTAESAQSNDNHFGSIQNLIQQRHYDQANNKLEEILEMDPNQSQALMYMGTIYLYRDLDHFKAMKWFERSLRLGGGAAFLVQHSHETLGGSQLADYCRGWLVLRNDAIEYLPENGMHAFVVSSSDLKEFKQNQRLQSMFHIKVKDHNFNFRPYTANEDEVLLIIAIYKKLPVN